MNQTHVLISSSPQLVIYSILLDFYTQLAFPKSSHSCEIYSLRHSLNFERFSRLLSYFVFNSLLSTFFYWLSATQLHPLVLHICFLPSGFGDPFAFISLAYKIHICPWTFKSQCSHVFGASEALAPNINSSGLHNP